MVKQEVKSKKAVNEATAELNAVQVALPLDDASTNEDEAAKPRKASLLNMAKGHGEAEADDDLTEEDLELLALHGETALDEINEAEFNEVLGETNELAKEENSFDLPTLPMDSNHTVDEENDNAEEPQEEQQAPQSKHRNLELPQAPEPETESEAKKTSQFPERSQNEEEGQKASSGSALGFGLGMAAGKALQNIRSFATRDRAKSLEAAENKYLECFKRMDSILEGSESRALRMCETNTGKVLKGFKDSNVAAPIDAMKASMSNDRDARSLWGELNNDAKQVERIAQDMKKLGSQAGLSPEKIAEDVTNSVDKYVDSVSDKVDGFVGSDGTSMKDSLSRMAERISKMLEMFIARVSSMISLGNKDGMDKAETLQSLQ